MSSLRLARRLVDPEPDLRATSCNSSLQLRLDVVSDKLCCLQAGRFNFREMPCRPHFCPSVHAVFFSSLSSCPGRAARSHHHPNKHGNPATGRRHQWHDSSIYGPSAVGCLLPSHAQQLCSSGRRGHPGGSTQWRGCGRDRHRIRCLSFSRCVGHRFGQEVIFIKGAAT